MLQIYNGPYTVNVDPDHGGCVTSLSHDGFDILRRQPDGQIDPLYAACFPCVPWFGRITEPVIVGGNPWLAPVTHALADGRFGIHGLGWVSKWTGQVQSEDHVRLRLDVPASDDGTPFSWWAEQTFHLGKDGLTIRLEAAHKAAFAIPFGLGFHPWFTRIGETSIAFQSGVPITPPGIDDLQDAPESWAVMHPLTEHLIDHTYGEWSGRAFIQYRDDGAKIALTADTSYLHLFAPPGRDFFCMEPVSHQPGRLQDSILGPEETMSVSMRIAMVI